MHGHAGVEDRGVAMGETVREKSKRAEALTALEHILFLVNNDIPICISKDLIGGNSLTIDFNNPSTGNPTHVHAGGMSHSMYDLLKDLNRILYDIRRRHKESM